MRVEKENKGLKNEGITLIALVITIIVLLILAGVAIATLTGENGVLTQAENAKKATEQAEEDEVAILDKYDKYINIEGDKKNFYGAEIKGYECSNSIGVNEWKIFYADDDNIYIISSDYIPYEYVPNSSKGNKPNRGSNALRSAYFTNILNDYTGTEDIKDEKIKKLNNDYFSKGYTSSKDSMKAVAYMLDTNAWSGFKGEKAEYAIGGPTIEMLIKSYNEKYRTNYIAEAVNETGYQVGNKNGLADWLRLSEESDELYGIVSQNNAIAMWLASTSSNGFILTGNGNNNRTHIGYHAYDQLQTGFRPIVCLKSDVDLEKNADGSFTIK